MTEMIGVVRVVERVAVRGRGVPGPRGAAVLNGPAPPGPDDGLNGDFWVDTAGHVLYGPKAAGAWPAGVPLVTVALLAEEVGIAVAGLVDGAPATLNTLNELAAALGDDPNLAATLMGLLGAETADRENADAALTAALAGKADVADLDDERDSRQAADAAITAEVGDIQADPRWTDQRTPLDGSVTTSKVADASIIPAKLSFTAATQAALDDETAAREALDGRVDAVEADPRWADQRVPLDGSVTTPKLADGAVTEAKAAFPVLTADDLETATAAVVRTAWPVRYDYRARINVPPGVRLRGGNIAPDLEQGWPHLFENWPALWPRVKAQVDRLAAAGGNAVRLIGGIGWPLADLTRLPTYLARWTQLLDYAEDKGLYVLPCGGDIPGQVPDGGATAAALLGVLRPWAEMLQARRAPIIGIDVLQELFFGKPRHGDSTPFSNGEIVALMTALLDGPGGLRDATDLPLTFSAVTDTDTGPGAWGGTFLRNEVGPLVDYWSVHLNRHAPAVAEANVLFGDPLVTPWVDKPVLIDEFGATQADSTATRQSRFGAVREVVKHPGVVGAFVWTIYPQSAVPANDWGLFDNGGGQRGDVMYAFRQIPTSRETPLPLYAGLAEVTLNQPLGTWQNVGPEIVVTFSETVRGSISINPTFEIMSGNEVTARMLIDGFPTIEVRYAPPATTIPVLSKNSPSKAYDGALFEPPELRVQMQVARVAGASVTGKATAESFVNLNLVRA